MQLLPQAVAVGGIGQRRVDDGQHVVAAVGLGQVVISTGLQPLPDLRRRVGGRLQDDRDAGQARLGLHPLQQPDAVQSGHHPVEKDQIETIVRGGQLRPCSFTAVGGDGCNARLILEVGFEDFQVQHLVIDQQNSCFAHDSPVIPWHR